MTGEQLYNRWREVKNKVGDHRGHAREPRWRNLKPWVKKVWEQTAEGLTTVQILRSDEDFPEADETVGSRVSDVSLRGLE